MTETYIVLLVALAISALWYDRRSSKGKLPPGPRKLPIVGNLFNMPSGGQVWLAYARMCHEYASDIIHLSALGNSVIVLNSAKSVSDLLEKRSSIYSSRPQLTMLHDMIGWKDAFSFSPYNDTWKAQRKLFTQLITPSDPARFYPKQIHATHALLEHLLISNDIMKELHHWAAVLIMDITYGINSKEAEPYITTAIEALDSIAIAGTPGAFLVDMLPFLKYVPEWFPGAGFKKKAKKWSELRIKMTEKPFIAAKKQIVKGNAVESLTSLALENIDLNQNISYQEDIIKGTAVTSYGVLLTGTHQVVAAVNAFILAMLLNMDIQRQAHNELDRVLGPGNLPTFDDESSLPYISAIVREVLRHNPITPLAIPHLLIQDDIYKDYFLLKGTVVIGNAWSILHDEETYPDPSVFNPSRFLDKNGRLNTDVMDPALIAFGFGRRICPGRHIAIASIWIAIASVLACYNIEKEVDKHGNVIEPSGKWFSGPSLFNRPLPFKCRFVPRSKEVEVALKAALDTN
ncbi:cytochrome P450 [Dendrothele bispora CBS 962.96]|uniref:Cytochrome P450 n=1 Tax=Dendrothele bispora (strain CBS 962.96) TaxID=1314807 RepID=A0A4S8KVR5_DENBC|nr:cytochrome P450 [Dendrothele bispora CBS 962.96]